MGIYEDLKLVEGRGAGIGPGQKWPKLFRLLTEDQPEGQEGQQGYLAGLMVRTELRNQGANVGAISTEEWAVIGSRFAADGVLHTRTAECAFLDEGFMRMDPGAAEVPVSQSTTLPAFEDGGALGL
jgi:hypothetical protein